MATEIPTSKLVSHFGRAVVLLLNRSMMYQAGHPFLDQGINDFLKNAEKLFPHVDPIIFILNQETFFVDEEPMDERVNTSRLVALFKKHGIQSISFGSGMDKKEVQAFVDCFVNLNQYPDADAFRQAVADKGATHIRINHVRYQKVTADDKVISREILSELAPQMDSGEVTTRKAFMESLLQSVLTEEFAKTLNIENLIANPGKLSHDMVMADLAYAEQPGAGSGGGTGTGTGSGTGAGAGYRVGSGSGGRRGVLLLQQMEALEIQMADRGDISLNALADAVFNMKKQLIEELESQKALGVAYENEAAILEKADALTDQVLIRLIRNEYKKGQISPERMAQLITRLIPEATALKRLLPQIKKAFFEEGMSAAQYLELVRELEKELQNENLAGIIRRSGEDIGVDGNQLIEEFKRNPEQAAQLVYLASEIRKSTGGDDETLTEILASYVEHISGQMAMNRTGGEDNPEHLKNVVRSIESGVISQLSQMKVQPDTLVKIEERLNARMDAVMDEMWEKWLASRKQLSRKTDAPPQQQISLLRMLEQSVGPDDALKDILKTVRAKVDAGELDENDVVQIQKEIDRQKQLIREQEASREMPVGVVKAGAIAFIIEKEIARASRYNSNFSALAFSMIKVTPKTKASAKTLSNDVLMEGVLARLSAIFRDVDIVGQIGKNTIIAVLPMSTRENSRKALTRIMIALNENPIEIRGIPMNFRFAGVAMTFDKKETPDAKSFIQRLFYQLQEMSLLLKRKPAKTEGGT
ncbi:GGDEF domain-containing protein [Desulfosarcina sp. OttesenSCG-928-G10]|nr:GGDEF domain-containing protein [Desulfosarcina sp. OttesenSCG-928-G10]MDL2321403.1 GGDEF domain-containing protein [Desulfosarcina sp. OttesenSCG-928-B08]